MEKTKRLFQCLMAVTIMLLGCKVLAANTTPIKQSYIASPISAQQKSKTNSFNSAACGYGTHIKVINRSDYDVYVRVFASGGPDFHLYPYYQGDNIDYIDSDDYYPSLRIMVLADDDYTVLYDGYVKNCHNLYVDNPYGDHGLTAKKSKASAAKKLRITQQ